MYSACQKSVTYSLWRWQWQTTSTNKMNGVNFLYLVAVFLLPPASSVQRCDRGRSRLVRKVVHEKLLPAFTKLNIEPSPECPFSTTRDKFRVQESHKSVKDGVRWVCHFCGKAFISEYFLDKHFDNRHPDRVENKDSVCLEDVCEVFRCDVISGAITPDYWDIALCIEDDMNRIYRKCTEMVKMCVPSGLSENKTEWLTNITTQELCSYLTCSKYWEIPFDSENSRGMTGLYIVMTVMTILSMIVYYFIFYSYFYTDTFSDSVTYDPTPRSRHPITPYSPDVRYRMGVDSADD